MVLCEEKVQNPLLSRTDTLIKLTIDGEEIKIENPNLWLAVEHFHRVKTTIKGNSTPFSRWVSFTSQI